MDFKYFTIALFYTVLLTALSLLPSAPTPGFSFDPSRFLTHMFAYFVLTSLWYLASDRLKESVVFAIIYGITLEILQSFTGRCPDIGDATFNGIGALSFVLFLRITKTYFRI